MKAKSLVFLAFLVSAPAFAIPGVVDCRTNFSDGSSIVQDFEFRPYAHDPGVYEVSIYIAKVPPFHGDPNATVSSEDPDTGPHWQVLTQKTVQGRISPDDDHLVYFDGNQGYFQLSRTRDEATVRLPGSRRAQRLENCVLPEPGITVHD